ncbi:MAG: hypothetical protein HQK52_12055 [Oligoflexia bacterium]|nr:hypothetical protein [Oligoflexia bacterium]
MKLKRIVLYSFMGLMLFPSCGKSYAEVVHSYLAIGTNFAHLGSARLGYGNYEIGIYAPGVYALNKLFFFTPIFYTALGAGFTVGHPGMAASIGFSHRRVFVGLGFRGEVFAYQSSAGQSRAAGTIGVSWSL